MGAGYAKLIPYLDAGPENAEDKLKKGYKRILTTGDVPVKSSMVWKQLSLDTRNDNKTMSNLQEAVKFIHAGRVKKENTLVITGQSDQDQIVFATAYFMVLSGLPPQHADRAVSNAVKDLGWKLNKPYMNALNLLRQKPPKQLRDEMFKASGEYSVSLLCEDVFKIYELAELPKPTESQVKLDAPLSVKEEHTWFGPPLGTPATPTSPESNKPSLQNMRSGSSKEEVGAELIKLARAAPPSVPDVDDSAQHISENTFEDLLKIRSSVAEVIEPEPVTFTRDNNQVNKPPTSIERPSVSNAVQKTPERDEPAPPKPVEPTPPPSVGSKAGEVTSPSKSNDTARIELIPEPRKDAKQNAAPPPGTVNGVSETKEKGSALLKISSLAPDITTMDNVGFICDLTKDQPSVTPDATHTKLSSDAPNKIENRNVSATPAPTESNRLRRKVNIIRSPKSAEVDLAKRVDAYFASTTEEERKKNRKHVVIVKSKLQSLVA